MKDSIDFGSMEIPEVVSEIADTYCVGDGIFGCVCHNRRNIRR